jgi:hypothetical protein
MYLSSVLAACASNSGLGSCELLPSEDHQLRDNVRSFLIDELADTFVYYDSEDAILSVIREDDGSCGILIYPAGDADDGSLLLHGEGIVLFDRETLEPTEVSFFVW